MVIGGLILAGALARLLPHPPNMTPMAAIALFGGATLPLRWALTISLGAMAVSDLALGLLAGDWRVTFHPTLPAVYASFAATVLLSRFFLRKGIRIVPLAVVTLTSSILFFVVTNFAVWLVGGLYPLTWEGLVACYVAALPFFRNSLVGDVLYTATLFGSYALLGRALGYQLGSSADPVKRELT